MNVIQCCGGGGGAEIILDLEPEPKLYYLNKYLWQSVWMMPGWRKLISTRACIGLYTHTHQAPSFPESLELPRELQVCIILNCLSAKLSDSRSLWPLSDQYCTGTLRTVYWKAFFSSRINDFLTKHSLVQYNLICFTHTIVSKKVILMNSWEKSQKTIMKILKCCVQLYCILVYFNYPIMLYLLYSTCT